MCSNAGVLLNCSRRIRVQSPAFMFIWIMLQLTTEIRRSFFRSKDCGSSRLSNVEFGLHKLRSQTLYNGLDGQICCWTCFLNNCWGLLICRSPSNNLPLLVLWMDFLRGSRVSMNAWGVTNAFHWQRYGLCYAKSVIQMLSVNLFNTNQLIWDTSELFLNNFIWSHFPLKFT